MNLPKITVEARFDKIEAIVDEINSLQIYKLFEDDDMVLINRAEVDEILARHVEVVS